MRGIIRNVCVNKQSIFKGKSYVAILIGECLTDPPTNFVIEVIMKHKTSYMPLW